MNTKECEFVNLCQNFGLLQDFCTRENSLLDLVLTNDPLLISGIKHNPPFGTSDHDSLLVDIILCFTSESACTNNGVNNIDNVHLNRATAYNWIKADWEGCAQFCSNICWPELLTNCFSSNELWQTFSLALQNGLDIFVPQKTISINGGRKNCKKKHPKNIKKLLRRKKTIWKASKKNTGLSKRVKYKKCVTLLKKAKFSNDLKNEECVINKNNVGAIYKYINSRLTHKSGIAPLKNSQNDLIVDTKEKAELLNTHFVSVGTVDDGVLPNISYTSDASFDSISFTTSRVLKVISKLKKNSAAGPDGLAPIICMSLKASLAYPLSLLFTAIFQNGVLPDEWKKAIVTPMFKKGKSSNSNNYRPIFLTCVCCKLFESVIKDQLLSYLTLYSLITDTQHGFLQKHSTVTNLAESLNNWTMSLEKKIPVKVLYIDFEKAFDKVSVPKLLHKLEHLGISGLLLQCIRSFLTQRTQAVRIDGVTITFLESNKVRCPRAVSWGHFYFCSLLMIYQIYLIHLFVINYLQTI